MVYMIQFIYYGTKVIVAYTLKVKACSHKGLVRACSCQDTDLPCSSLSKFSGQVHVLDNSNKLSYVRHTDQGGHPCEVQRHQIGEKTNIR